MPRNTVQVIFQAVDRVSREVARINRSFSLMGRLAVRLASSVGAFLAIRRVIEAADTYTLLESRVRLVTESAEELAAVQEELFEISQDTRSALDSTTDLYTRLARTTTNLGLSQRELLEVTESVNQAIIIGGATAQEARAGVIQFAQGLAFGALRGDELRSVMEQLPGLARAIAQGMGVGIGELRRLGEQGKLTAEVITQAIQQQAPEIQRQFAQITPTVTQSLTQLGNSFLSLVGDIDDAIGASDLFTRAIRFVTRVVEDLEEAVEIENLDTYSDQIDFISDEIARLKGLLGEGLPEAIPGLTARGYALIIEQAAKNEEAIRQRIKSLEAFKAELQLKSTEELTGGGVNLDIQTNKQAINQSLNETRQALKEALDIVNQASNKLDEVNEKYAAAAEGIISRTATVAESHMVAMQETLDLTKKGFLTTDQFFRNLDRETKSAIEKIRSNLETVDEEVEQTTDVMTVYAEQAARNMQDALADFFFDPFKDGLKGLLKSFIDTIRRMVAEVLAAKVLERLFGGFGTEGSSGLGGFLGKIFGGGRESGGPVVPGKVYRVNEREPEFLLTRGRGNVVPLSQMASVGAGGAIGGGSVVNFINNIEATSPVTPEEMEYIIERANDMALIRVREEFS